MTMIAFDMLLKKRRKSVEKQLDRIADVLRPAIDGGKFDCAGTDVGLLFSPRAAQKLGGRSRIEKLARERFASRGLPLLEISIGVR